MASGRSLCDWLGRDRRRCGVQPCSESLPYQFDYCVPIFENRFHPCAGAHLWKINSQETEAWDKDVDAITQRLVIERIHCLFDCLRTVRVSPPNSHFVMSFVDAHLQRRMCHRKRYELLPPRGRLRSSRLTGHLATSTCFVPFPVQQELAHAWNLSLWAAVSRYLPRPFPSSYGETESLGGVIRFRRYSVNIVPPLGVCSNGGPI